MAMLWGNDWDPNALITCPYDPSHRIATKRYQFHIVKCRKNHPDKDFVPCPFNARHVVLRPNLKKHIVSCPDKKLLEPDIRHQTLCKETGEVEDVIVEGRQSPTSSARNSSSCEAEEDWDAEAEFYMAEKERRRQDDIQNSMVVRRFSKSDRRSDTSSESDSSSLGLYEIKRTLSCKGQQPFLPNSRSSTQTPSINGVAEPCASRGPPFHSGEEATSKTDRIFSRIQSANYVPISTDGFP